VRVEICLLKLFSVRKARGINNLLSGLFTALTPNSYQLTTFRHCLEATVPFLYEVNSSWFNWGVFYQNECNIGI